MMRSAAHALALAASLAGPYMPYMRALRGRRDPHAYQTDEQREAARARNAAKQARKNARRLALRARGLTVPGAWLGDGGVRC